MSGRGKVRSALRGAAATTFWLAGAGLPAWAAAGQPVVGPFDASGVAAIPEVTVVAPTVLPAVALPPGAGEGADLVATAGLRRYAMSNPQLRSVRGGFTTGNGVTFNFGFAQVTTVNGTVVEGLLVQNNQASALAGAFNTPQYNSSPVTSSASATASYIVLNGVVITGANGQPALSTNPGFTPNMTPDPSKPITVTSTANNGATTITTTLGSNGIVNSIGNVANNQLINQATVESINVSGLAASIAAEQAANAVMRTIGIR